MLACGLTASVEATEAHKSRDVLTGVQLRVPEGAPGSTDKPFRHNALSGASPNDLASVYEFTQCDETSTYFARHHSSDDGLHERRKMT
jgi:hypothetical protein